MRKSLILLSALAVLFSGCRDNSGIRSYWASHNVDVESDFKTAESQFTDFVELASAAPEADAFAAIDMLLAKARKNEVAYLVYTEWIYRGFSSILSPCRSCPIFIHAADKILSHGILRDELAQQYDRRRAFCRYNRAGDTAVIPAPVPPSRHTLYLVVDQDCPSCKESMVRIGSWDRPDTYLAALCYGHGPLPSVPGWDCFRLDPDQKIIDTSEAPFFFVVSEDGIVKESYTPAY
ncbi:MAG: DUF5106 domain-containing protein [Treponema sp.]|nr:DUF5106 domain-containing protein [Treponema sp.]